MSNKAPEPVAKPRRDVASVVAKQRIMPLAYWRPLAGGAERDETVFLEAMVAHFGPETRAIPIGRARSGFHLLTQAAISEGRRKVLMSSYTIPDVVKMVTLAGGEPVFYDFEPDATAASLDSLSRLIDCETACVVVTHYHVNEVRLAEIAALCRAHGARLFDDCAIAFGGVLDGAPIGVHTDASVFSSSSFKLLNYFWGGLVTTRDEALAERIARVVESWPRLRARDYAPQAKACARYDFASRPLAFRTLVFPMLQRRLKAATSTRGLEHVRVESISLDATLTSRPAMAAFAEWREKLGQVDQWVERRRAIAAIYRRRLAAHMVGRDTPGPILAGSCFTNFPILAPAERRGAVVRELILRGFDVGANLYPNTQRQPGFTEIAGESANVDRLVAASLYLPTHFGVSEDYAEALAEETRALLDNAA